MIVVTRTDTTGGLISESGTRVNIPPLGAGPGRTKKKDFLKGEQKKKSAPKKKNKKEKEKGKGCLRRALARSACKAFC
jgi:hypothetical protein